MFSPPPPTTAYMWIIGYLYQSLGVNTGQKSPYLALCRWNVKIDANTVISITTRVEDALYLPTFSSLLHIRKTLSA